MFSMLGKCVEQKEMIQCLKRIILSSGSKILAELWACFITKHRRKGCLVEFCAEV